MAARNFFLSTLPFLQGIFTQKSVVFCDFDGPIVDVSERYYRTYRKGLLAVEELHVRASGQSLGLQLLSKTEFWQMKQNRVPDREIAARSQLPDGLFELFMQQVTGLVNHPSLLKWDRLQPSAQAALNHLKRCNVRLVLVTLRHPQQVQMFLCAQGIEHLVDDVYGVFDLKAAHANRVEQKRELLAAALTEQKSKGYFIRGSWMVGDTEADILAGQSMGLFTAALSCGVRSEAYLQKLAPSEIYGCLLTAARKVADTPVLQAA